MKKSITRILLGFMLMMLGFGLFMSIEAQAVDQKYSFTISVDAPEDEITCVYAKKFADAIIASSGGRILVRVYPNATLGGDRESIESCIKGNITFVVQNTAPQVNFMPKLAIFDLPCAFDSLDGLRKAVDDPIFFGMLCKVYEDAGLKAFHYTDQGFRVMTSNKKVEKLEDFKGIKIRTMENANHIAFWKAIGANPTPMAFGEVYIGLQQETIDGLENPYEGIATSKFYEQQKYCIDTNHVPHLVSLIMSKKVYDALSDGDKQLITDAAQKARDDVRAQDDKVTTERIAIIKNSGTTFIHLSPEERVRLRERSKSVYDKIATVVGAELVDAMNKAAQ